MRLGIDLGGTKLALAVGDREGRILGQRRRASALSGDWRIDVARLVEEARALLEETARTAPEAGRLEAIGVAVPSPLDAAAGLVLRPPNLPGWDAVPLGPRLADAFGVPTRLENDANAAALAEWRYGAGQGALDLVYLTMSTGVGAGIVLGGQLQRGTRGGAGEFGHLRIEDPGEACACGLRGCFESVCGGRAWQSRLRETTPSTSEVLRRAGAREAIEPRHLLEAAAAGDAFARRELDRWLDGLAAGVAHVVMALDPERIVLGTIASAAGHALCFAPLRARLRTRVWPERFERLDLRPAALGETLPFRAGLAVAEMTEVANQAGTGTRGQGRADGAGAD